MPKPGSGANEPAAILSRRPDLPQPPPGATFVLVEAHWMPGDPPRPAPHLMTGDEVAEFCRLTGKHASSRLYALARFRARGLLRGTRIGGGIRYRLPDVIDFLETLSRLPGPNGMW